MRITGCALTLAAGAVSAKERDKGIDELGGKYGQTTHPNYFRAKRGKTLRLVSCWHEMSDHRIDGRTGFENLVSQAGFEPLSDIPWHQAKENPVKSIGSNTQLLHTEVKEPP